MPDLLHSDQKLTIAEAVELLKREGYDVTSNKLRQYEKQGLLFPEKKLNSKYRLYSDTDLTTIRQILALISLNFSIKEIKYFIELWGKAHEILYSFSDIEQKTDESKKIEKLLNEKFKEAKKNKLDTETLNKDASEFDKKHLSLVLTKWTALETNKNYLILVKFIDFHNRIVESIKSRMNMLEALKKIKFRQNYTEPFKEVVDALQKRLQTK